MSGSHRAITSRLDREWLLLSGLLSCIRLIFSVYASLSPFSNAHLLRANYTFQKAMASSKRKISNYEIGSSFPHK